MSLDVRLVLVAGPPAGLLLGLGSFAVRLRAVSLDVGLFSLAFGPLALFLHGSSFRRRYARCVGF